MTDKLLSAIAEQYPLTEISVGEFANVKVSALKFKIRAFDAEGLGRVSVMTASGMLGLMKMDTLMINPIAIDMPLLSYDRIYAMGNDTLIYELYDTMTIPQALTATAEAKAAGDCLPERDPGEHWYDSIKLPQSISKKGKKMHTVPFDVLTANYLKGYLTDCAAAPGCDRAAKQEKTQVYVEGLLAKGGPATDGFLKAIGSEKTAYLFRHILFGTCK